MPPARLEFQPAATRCVQCQGQWDRLNGRSAWLLLKPPPPLGSQSVARG
ncbi:MAG: hypothetical protein ABI334_07275 [Candidatus Dormiibacterota bacterium]